MNIVYLFLTYKNPELLLHTIQRLKAPHVEFYVHVDASSGEDFSCLQGIDGVYVFVNQHNTTTALLVMCMRYVDNGFNNKLLVSYSNWQEPLLVFVALR